jgi:hypothetical protein
MDLFKSRKILLIVAGSFFCSFILFASIKTAFLTSNTTERQIQEIDGKIDELRKMKRGYEAKALQHESMGQRLQFVEKELLTAKKHWQLADKNRQIARKIEYDIEAYEQKKQELVEALNADMSEDGQDKKDDQEDEDIYFY